MKKIFGAIVALFAFACVAHAQNLPAGSLGTVTNNTANSWQSFSYNFTPSQTGANFIGFAFRQDPAFWTFDNVRLTAAGSTTNLLTNGAFNTGGSFNVTTSNGPSSIQAPTNWGVWYQNGTYPAAAGTWTDIGGSHGGVWYDGAVGSFDGIYQGVSLTAGTQYTITFDVSGNNTANTSSIQLGIYGGACASVSIAAANCTIPSSVGFTTLATPAQGAAAGGPPTPTLVSEVNIASTSTTSTAYGTPTVVTRVVDASTNNRVSFTVTRTTTPITSTPFTTTVVTTPHTLQTYSDNSTVTTNGTATTTVTNGTNVVVGNSTSQSQTASSTGAKDAIALRNFNLFLVNPLNQKDGAWLTPFASYAKTNGSYRTGGSEAGYQWTADNNTFGVALQYSGSNSGNLVGSTVDGQNFAGNMYGLIRDVDYWLKLSFGAATGENKTSTSIPLFSLYNNNKFRQNNYYADITLYTPNAYEGFRPLLGATVNASQIGNSTETGTSLLSTAPDKGTTKQFNPYVGVRYEFDKDIGLEGRVTHNADFKTVAGVKATVNKEVFDGVFLNGGLGFDKGSNYQAVVGTVGVKVAF
mgnify:CR=1 FL=1